MFRLPDIDYDYGALSPQISADIMQLHHSKHHQTYVDKLNNALSKIDTSGSSLEELLARLDQIPAEVRQAVRNNGGGHWNHSQFWCWMSPNGGGEPSGKLAEAIIGKYGSFQGFVDKFTTEAVGVFGSGWCWLMPDMEIITTANQDNPIMQNMTAPLLGLDVWEHAYYLDYKNKRDDYIDAWWDVVNWQYVTDNYSV